MPEPPFATRTLSIFYPERLITGMAMFAIFVPLLQAFLQITISGVTTRGHRLLPRAYTANRTLTPIKNPLNPKVLLICLSSSSSVEVRRIRISVLRRPALLFSMPTSAYCSCGTCRIRKKGNVSLQRCHDIDNHLTVWSASPRNVGDRAQQEIVKNVLTSDCLVSVSLARQSQGCIGYG